MKRESRLLFTSERLALEDRDSFQGETLFLFEDGVPVSWLLMFGGRNVWNVGDVAKDRGGAVGQRNLFETEIETAITRLDHALDVLAANSECWPWFSAAAILRRKLVLKPKHHLVRLAAPWTSTLEPEHAEEWKRSTAFLENFVNFHEANRSAEAIASIRRLEAFCPFLPEGHGVDRTRFAKLPYFTTESDQAVRLAKMMIGGPASGEERYRKAVAKDVTPILEEHLASPPATSPSFASIKQASKEQVEPGFMGKLAGFFKRKA